MRIPPGNIMVAGWLVFALASQIVNAQYASPPNASQTAPNSPGGALGDTWTTGSLSDAPHAGHPGPSGALGDTWRTGFLSDAAHSGHPGPSGALGDTWRTGFLSAPNIERIAPDSEESEPISLDNEMLPPSDAQSIKDLQKQVKALQDSTKAAQSKFPKTRLTGFFHLDGGMIGQDPVNRATVGDMQNGIGFRRARLQAVGDVAEFTRYSLEMDFATAGRPSFMDVWGEQWNLPVIGALRIGQFRQPTTMDAWTSIRHLEFMERSLPFQALDPFRRVGAMAWRNVGDDDVGLIAASVYGTGFTFLNPANSTPTYGTLGDTRYATQVGDTGGISAAIRASGLVYYDPYAENRYLLHVGGGYNYSQIGGDGRVGGLARTYEARAIPEFFVGDPIGGGPALGTPAVVDTGRFLANDFHFAHAELGGNYGSVHFQAEYLATVVNQMGGPAVFYDGAYVQGGYFLTGEAAGYNKQMGALDYNVKPYSEFFGVGNSMCGWGAWEVAGRWSFVDLRSTAVLPANILGPTNPGVVNNTTLALNWYWNQFARVQLNWIHGFLNNNATGNSNYDIGAVRFQTEF